MLRIRAIRLALVAVFAFSAITTTVAQAELPEYGIPGGFPKEFLAGFMGEGKLVTMGTNGGTSREVRCKNGGTGEGTIANAKETTKTVVHFKGCKLKAKIVGEIPCKTEGVGAAPEEIVTLELVGKLRYLAELRAPVGVVLDPEAGAGALFAEFLCTGLFGDDETIKVLGTTIGEIDSKLNVLQAEQKLEFEQNGGLQHWLEYFDGDTKVKPQENETTGEGTEDFGEETSAMETVNLIVLSLTAGGNWEIKA